MSAPGRILVVDADYGVLDDLANALRARGHSVALATDGRTGLQSAVDLGAEVVVVDREVEVLDVRTFLDVLRDNPRTSGAHCYVMGTAEPGHLASIDGRAEPIVKPFHAPEIAARIDEVIRKRREPEGEQELRGDLRQVSLFDLVQVFSVNRRTGRLRIESAGFAGAIYMVDGTLTDAVQGYVTGEKAVYRVLAQREGSFVFTPDAVSGERRVHAKTDALLMDAARRSDEVARLFENDLPSRGATLSVTGAQSAKTGLGAEILDRLDEPRSIEELLDVLPAHDLEILSALKDLLEDGCLHVFESAGRVRFCHVDELAALRAAALRLRRPGLEGRVRLGVVADRAIEVRRFGRALSQVHEFMPPAAAPADAGDGLFGSLGTIRLGGTDLELFALPLEESFRPLWGATLNIGRVLLALGETLPGREVDELTRQLDLRMHHVETGFERPGGAVDAVRSALSGR